MGTLEDLAKKIIGSLSKDELHQLAEIYDDGSIEALCLAYIYPEDKKSYPNEYYEEPPENDDDGLDNPPETDPDNDPESDPTYLAGYDGESIP